jgi:hypothetical protein
MTARALWDSINNAFDFLFDKQVLLYTQSVALRATSVSWHSYSPADFLLDDDGTINQYLRWLSSGQYSAMLLDGSLLQMSYRVEGGGVVQHRLNYVPCPVALDEDALAAGDPVAELVELQAADDPFSSVVLRSAVRFDYDPANAAEGHPAAHLTINDVDCRIACVAPLHPHRFLAFVFQHFYPALHLEHAAWFTGAGSRNLRYRAVADRDRQSIHLSWPA